MPISFGLVRLLPDSDISAANSSLFLFLVSLLPRSKSLPYPSPSPSPNPNASWARAISKLKTPCACERVHVVQQLRQQTVVQRWGARSALCAAQLGSCKKPISPRLPRGQCRWRACRRSRWYWCCTRAYCEPRRPLLTMTMMSQRLDPLHPRLLRKANN